MKTTIATICLVLVLAGTANAETITVRRDARSGNVVIESGSIYDSRSTAGVNYMARQMANMTPEQMAAYTAEMKLEPYRTDGKSCGVAYRAKLGGYAKRINEKTLAARAKTFCRQRITDKTKRAEYSDVWVAAFVEGFTGKVAGGKPNR